MVKKEQGGISRCSQQHIISVGLHSDIFLFTFLVFARRSKNAISLASSARSVCIFSRLTNREAIGSSGSATTADLDPASVVVRSVGRRGNIAAACPSAFFRLYFFHNQQKQQLLLRRSRSFDRAHITNSTHNYSAALRPENLLRRRRCIALGSCMLQ